MEIVRYSDAREFLDNTSGFLTAVIARNQVLLGVAAMAADQPDVYPRYEAFVVLDDGTPVLAAAQTPPHNFLLSDGQDDEQVIGVMCAALARSGLEVPGVLGNVPLAGRFAKTWAGMTGSHAIEVISQGVFSLEQVADLPLVAGVMRDGNWEDRRLVLDWFEAFNAEALPDGAHRSLPLVEERVDQRLDPERDQGLSLWMVEGDVVSMSGFSPPVANSVRIGPVYTPPAHRGHGYATALVAAQSRRFLAEGRDRCLLHTDLANPTSNAIYERIGYRKVAEAAEYRFEG